MTSVWTISAGMNILWGVAFLSPCVQRIPHNRWAPVVSGTTRVCPLAITDFPGDVPTTSFPGSGRAIRWTIIFYTTHSELNAILNYQGGSLEDQSSMSLFPCNECAKAIIQSGIKTVIYECDKYDNTPSVIASKRMLKAAG